MITTLRPAAMSDFELNVISSQISSIKDKKIYVEIGSRYGGSLLYFGRLMPKNSKLIAIDLPNGPWGHLNSEISLNSDGYNVDLIFGDSKSKETEDKLVSSLSNQQIDILFIDGDHSLLGVSSDINIYTKYVKQGGIVIFHDCGDIKSVGTDLSSFKTMRSVRSAFDDFSYGRKKLIVQEDWGLGIVWV
jgi:predicted O-methyltransferase YrrM